jgi:allantoate deiminase
LTLWDRLQTLGRIGALPGEGGGLWRAPFTPAEGQAVTQVRAWMEAGGLLTRRDPAGNLFGRRPGGDPLAPAVLVGSHLDTVRGGGAYDGALGVLAAMEAIRGLPELRAPVEVVAFTNEEGNRYPGLFGSRAFAGEVPAAELDVRDADGVALRDAMTGAGLDPAALPECVPPAGRYAAFLELHIEQGPVLERAALPVGIVTDIVGLRQASVHLRGRPDHAGTTPMAERADALRAAAIALADAGAAAERLGPPAVLTCGRIAVSPGSPNVVPGEVTLTLDMRDADSARLGLLAGSAREAFATAAERCGVALEWEARVGLPPTPMAAHLCGILEDAAAALGLASRRMVSGAGHDAMVVARVMPAAMVFVPCRGGRSHAPEEYASPEACANGAAVLREAILRCAS